jgi:hypothetical protein
MTALAGSTAGMGGTSTRAAPMRLRARLRGVATLRSDVARIRRVRPVERPPRVSPVGREPAADPVEPVDPGPVTAEPVDAAPVGDEPDVGAEPDVGEL